MKRLIVGVLLPMMLWAWNRDIHVITRPDSLPIAYDFVVPSDSEMYVVMQYYDDNNVAYKSVVYTNDYGTTWNYLDNTFDTNLNSHPQPINIIYYADTLYYFTPLGTSSHYFSFVVKPLNDPFNSVGDRGDAFNDLDSVQCAYMTVAKDGNHVPYFYLVALGWKNGADARYSVLRSTDFGSTWKIVYSRLLSPNSPKIRELQSLSSYDYGDSVRLLFAYTYQDTSTGVNKIYYNVLTDTMGDTLVETVSLQAINTSMKAQVRTASLYGLEAIAYIDSGRLYIDYSSDNWVTIKHIDYPYNGDYDGIYDVDMVPWFTYISNGGLNIAYTASVGGYVNVYYQEMIADGDSIYCNNTPVQVSDSGAYTYIFNTSPYYHPKIRNWQDYAIPYVLWHNDFSHLVTIYFIYDSTQFFIDHMYNTQVKENKKAEEITPSLSLSLNHGILRMVSSTINGYANLDIMDISGRKIMHKVVRFNNGEARTELHGLKNGLYFALVHTAKGTLKGKFLKLR